MKNRKIGTKVLEDMLKDLCTTVLIMQKSTMNCGICAVGNNEHKDDCPVLCANKIMEDLGWKWSADLEDIVKKGNEKE